MLREFLDDLARPQEGDGGGDGLLRLFLVDLEDARGVWGQATGDVGPVDVAEAGGAVVCEAVDAGGGGARAARSSACGKERNRAGVAWSGGRRPAGGISPARSWRTTGSQWTPLAATADRSGASSVRPTARSCEVRAVAGSFWPLTTRSL